MADPQAGLLLREARRRAGLSQIELAKRARTTQSVISAYESGVRQPSYPTLARLVAAAGSELDVKLRRRRTPPQPQGLLGQGPLGVRLMKEREEVRRTLARYGLTSPRVFGSVARGEDTPASDIDLLVDVAPGVGLFGLARCQRELQALLQASIDLVPASDLKPGVAPWVLAEAVRL